MIQDNEPNHWKFTTECLLQIDFCLSNLLMISSLVIYNFVKPFNHILIVQFKYIAVVYKDKIIKTV